MANRLLSAPIIAPAISLSLIAAPASAHDLSAGAHDDGSLPVGDGRVTTESPQVGYVYSCTSDFRGNGARHFGGWLQGDRWYPAEKVTVQGSKSWPEAYFEMEAHGERMNVRMNVRMNSLPTNHATGTFPISRDDPAYEFDTNPNPIAAQRLDFTIPLSPQRARAPQCLRRGMIGFTLNGVSLYHALDDAGLDAAAHEVQDKCGGHPSGRGQYHYHAGSPCIPGIEENSVIGWALDGYPIMGMAGADGSLYTNDTLDACHGEDAALTVDGRTYDYAYRVTREYPYTLGCYTGMPVPGIRQAINEGLNERRQRGRRGGGDRRGGREGNRRPRRDR